MVIFGSWKNKSLTLSIKPGSLTISLQSPGDSQVYSFDGEGRLWTAMLENRSFRRGLNGKIVAKWQIPGSNPSAIKRDRRWLTPDETAQLEERSRVMISNLIEGLRTGETILQANLTENEVQLLAHAEAFTFERYQQDVNTFLQVYHPVGILPPDQYMATVLQATEGCSFNTCTFCTFYRDRRFRIKQEFEFRAHARAVKNYLGEGLHLRRTIFLGDANALVIPMPRLLNLLNIVNEEFDVEQMGGIYAFLDGFSGDKKTAKDYAQMAELGIKRIYIGMESGSDELLNFIQKPGKSEDVVQAVKAIKAGGIAVGIIVLLGAGGKYYAPVHVRNTIEKINAMKLGMDDLIYFSELIESEGMEYTADAYQHKLQPLSSTERILQGDEIEAGLVFSEKGGMPHISRYDIREFVY